ncbi:hypothetical protein BU17DRAFT_67650 [Hysterangium stoloniferum]|nr:hypothetical protein BU17DRAFT_67650 [Hysterangium stoloniferum]
MSTPCWTITSVIVIGSLAQFKIFINAPGLDWTPTERPVDQSPTGFAKKYTPSAILLHAYVPPGGLESNSTPSKGRNTIGGAAGLSRERRNSRAVTKSWEEVA